MDPLYMSLIFVFFYTVRRRFITISLTPLIDINRGYVPMLIPRQVKYQLMKEFGAKLGQRYVKERYGCLSQLGICSLLQLFYQCVANIVQIVILVISDRI